MRVVALLSRQLFKNQSEWLEEMQVSQKIFMQQ